MGFWDIFRRPPPINEPGDLAEFIDMQAAFLAQKGIYEYSRARAGHYAKVLFAEVSFQHAVEQSRWRAFPLGLAIVTEIVEGLLRRHAGDDRRAVLDSLSRSFCRFLTAIPFRNSSRNRNGWRRGANWRGGLI